MAQRVAGLEWCFLHRDLEFWKKFCFIFYKDPSFLYRENLSPQSAKLQSILLAFWLAGVNSESVTQCPGQDNCSPLGLLAYTRTGTTSVSVSHYLLREYLMSSRCLKYNCPMNEWMNEYISPIHEAIVLKLTCSLSSHHQWFFFFFFFVPPKPL